MTDNPHTKCTAIIPLFSLSFYLTSPFIPPLTPSLSLPLYHYLSSLYFLAPIGQDFARDATYLQSSPAQARWQQCPSEEECKAESWEHRTSSSHPCSFPFCFCYCYFCRCYFICFTSHGISKGWVPSREERQSHSDERYVFFNLCWRIEKSICWILMWGSLSLARKRIKSNLTNQISDKTLPLTCYFIL